MNRLRRALALSALLVYLLSGVLGEVLHHDEEASGSGTAITAHTCQGQERHVPLEGRHGCPACLQAGQRLSLPDHPAWLPATVPALSAPSPAARAPLLPAPAGLLPAKRGPPAA